MPNEEMQVLTSAEWRTVVDGLVADERDLPIRRREPRHDLAVTIQTQLVRRQRDGRQTRWIGQLVQASVDGVMVKTHEPVPDDALVRVEMQLCEAQFALNGRVMHCTQTVGAYKVGIELVFDDGPP